MKISNINNDMTIQNLNNQLQKSQSGDFEKKLKSAIDAKDEKELKKASKEIESIYINMILKEMRKTISKSDLVESSPGREIWESMLDEKISEEAANGKGFGIAEMIYKQVTRDMKNTYKIEE